MFRKTRISQWKSYVVISSSLIVALFGFADWTFGQDVFPDKALEAVVRKEVFAKRYNTEPITAEDVKNISQVVGKGKGIKSLEGLQHCKSIMQIDLANNEIVDLAPLKDLKLVQLLDLSGNKIESIEPIAGLTNLQYLS